ncbi:unnamed protein product [Cylicocyclus nassatus]|uniref:G-protein coupled receptors family 1 profile domain-containing protein n=1 Tax=Cylicocyclus nassatus TaxID=53992 RepID=A0AA36H335_CYLNA|nr:unnamed protein product [Cylicocyclus nassatus]
MEENANDTTGDENLPVLSFLPPTEEPSSVEIATSVALVACLTIAICGNASQIVLQIYTKRLKRQNPSQFFITLLFIIHFLIPLGLPMVVLEKLVKIWMFGPFSCSAYHSLASAGRVLTPWAIMLLHLFIGMLLSRPSRVSTCNGTLSIFAFISMFVPVLLSVVPEGLAAQLEIIPKDEIKGEQYIMLIHTIRCTSSQESAHGTLRATLEFILPLLLCASIQLWLLVVAKLSFHSVIFKSLLTILIIYFFCYILHYIPAAKKEMESIVPIELDLRQTLPFVAPAVIWYPLSCLSAALCRGSADKSNDEQQPHFRSVGRTAELERSHLMGSEIIVL